MLGKLLKHEFKSYGLSMGIIFLASSLLALFMKILSMFPYKENARDGIQILMVFGFVMIMVLTNVAVTVMIVIRFYSTTASDQAYLTWTLPAKTSTILWSKLLAGIFWRLISACAIVAMGAIFFTGSYWLWHEQLQDAFFGGGISLGMMLNEMLKEFVGDFNAKQVAGFIIYYIGTFIWGISGILLIYMCIGIGQLFGKYRVIASIGFYFLIMIIVQIISTVGVAILSGITYRVDNSSDIFMGRYGLMQSIISEILAIVVSGVLFAITNLLFDKHLNLD